ncbi:DUF2750 domain-containing protein [Shouchella miscanthi]|uniref:DUF2750 domain-containing protein n=1 Tax=Shouchella miscanthi TaxID=2598861 RepID=UPI0011A706AF|nr:DUF2750 domain-containing protein [Shouchella miscanthi]
MSNLYKVYLDQIVKQDKVWTLSNNDGWVTLASENNEYNVSFWVEKEQAKLAATKFWEGCEPEEIKVEELLNGILEELVEDNVGISFYIDESSSINVSPSDLLNNLLFEKEIINRDIQTTNKSEYWREYIEEKDIVERNKNVIMLDVYKYSGAINEEYFNSLFNASKKKRYEAFIKIICREEMLYTISIAGKFTILQEDGQFYFPVWPVKDFADKCLTGNWLEGKIVCINFEEWVSLILNYFEKENIKVAVFPNDSTYLAVEAKKLLIDIEKELDFY